jgi:hypothetical protein
MLWHNSRNYNSRKTAVGSPSSSAADAAAAVTMAGKSGRPTITRTESVGRSFTTPSSTAMVTVAKQQQQLKKKNNNSVVYMSSESLFSTAKQRQPREDKLFFTNTATKATAIDGHQKGHYNYNPEPPIRPIQEVVRQVERHLYLYD